MQITISKDIKKLQIKAKKHSEREEKINYNSIP